MKICAIIIVLQNKIKTTFSLTCNHKYSLSHSSSEKNVSMPLTDIIEKIGSFLGVHGYIIINKKSCIVSQLYLLIMIVQDIKTKPYIYDI
jgi:hypothetical protein